MDYADNFAQIGGFGLPMPAPQLYYPEMNGVPKDYDQTPVSETGSHHFPSDNTYEGHDSVGDGDTKYIGKFFGHCKAYREVSPDNYEGNYKMEHEDMHNEYRPEHYTQNSASSYRSQARNSRRAREMSLRNGLYSPRDGNPSAEFPYFTDNVRRSTRNSYW